MVTAQNERQLAGTRALLDRIGEELARLRHRARVLERANVRVVLEHVVDHLPVDRLVQIGLPAKALELLGQLSLEERLRTKLNTLARLATAEREADQRRRLGFHVTKRCSRHGNSAG